MSKVGYQNNNSIEQILQINVLGIDLFSGLTHYHKSENKACFQGGFGYKSTEE